MESNEQFRKRLEELFRSENLAGLATHCNGQPYASLVAFYADEDLKHIYFVTPKTTRKYGNLTADYRVAASDKSGVVFTRNPNDETQGVIESVYGLNQGLVDGDVEPDRWIMDRSRNKIVSHTTPERKYWIIPSRNGVRLAELPGEKSADPPLTSHEVEVVFKTARKSEDFFKLPQDVEWTFEKDALVLLQSRPITTLRTDKPEDQRSWYLSLHRSFDNLKNLRRKIEEKLIPGMISAAESLNTMDPAKLADEALGLKSDSAGRSITTGSTFTGWTAVHYRYPGCNHLDSNRGGNNGGRLSGDCYSE